MEERHYKGFVNVKNYWDGFVKSDNYNRQHQAV